MAPDDRQTSAAHTPGPWRAEIHDFGFGVFPTKPTIALPPNVKQHSIASSNLYEHSAYSAFFDAATTAANARLIAAAPDMLAALEAAMPYLDNSDSPGGCDGKHSDCEHCAAIARARSALSRAKGERT